MAYIRRQPACCNAFTVKRVLVIFTLVAVNGALQAQAQRQREPRLGSKCQHDMDCTDFIKGSACSANGFCECAPYYVQYNATSCLSSQLLGGDCVLNDQCTMKVANSSCLDGACRCVEGFLQFRKHTCLGPALPGAVCYSNAHCNMFDKRSHCDFLIPNLFGRCQCTAPARLVGGFCLANDVTAATAAPVSTTAAPTTTSTTTTTVAPKTTVATTTTTTAPKTTAASTTTTSAAAAAEEQNIPAVDPVRYDSVEEQINSAELPDSPANSDADMEIPTTTAQHLFTPAVAAADEQSQSLAANEILTQESTPAVDDYPYKIDEEYEEAVQQQQQQQIAEEQQQYLLDNQEHIETQEQPEYEHSMAAEPVREVLPVEDNTTPVAEQINNDAETAQDIADNVAYPAEKHELQQVPAVEEQQHFETEVVDEEEDKIETKPVAESVEEQISGTTQAVDIHAEVNVDNDAAPAEETDAAAHNIEQEQQNFENLDVQQNYETEHATEKVTQADEMEHIADEVPVAEHEAAIVNEPDTNDQVAIENVQKPESVAQPQIEEESQQNELNVDESPAGPTLPHEVTEESISLPSENQYLDLHNENHFTADELDMYEDLEHEVAPEADAGDDTMKFDYETVQEELNTENTVAPASIGTASWPEESNTAAVADSLAQATTHDEHENQNVDEQQYEEIKIESASNTEQIQSEASASNTNVDAVMPAENVEIESVTTVNELTADNINSKPALETQEHNISDEFEEEAKTERIAQVSEPKPDNGATTGGLQTQMQTSNDEQQIAHETDLLISDNDGAETQPLTQVDVEISPEQSDKNTAQVEQEMTEKDVDALSETVTETSFVADNDVAGSELMQQVVEHEEGTDAPTLDVADQVIAATQGDELHIAEATEALNVSQAPEETILNEAVVERDTALVAGDHSVVEETIVEEAKAPTEAVLFQETETETDNQNENEQTANLIIEDMNENDSQVAESEAHTERVVLDEQVTAATVTELNSENDAEVNKPEHVAHNEPKLDDAIEPSVDRQAAVLENVETVDASQTAAEATAEGALTINNESTTDESKPLEDLQQTDHTNEIATLEQESHTEQTNHVAQTNPIKADTLLSGTNVETANLAEASTELAANDNKDSITTSTENAYAHTDSFEMGNVHQEQTSQEQTAEDFVVFVDQTESNLIDSNDEDESQSESLTHSDIYSGSFEENESIADILSDLMSEDATTVTPLESVTEAAAAVIVEQEQLNNKETSNAEEHTPDLFALATNRAEERLDVVTLVETTEAQQENGEKLITFYPEMQDLSAHASNDIETQDATHTATLADTQELESEQHTLSPEELPFDMTSIDDIQPQELESDSLVLESSTTAAVALQEEEEEASGSGAQELRAEEATATPDDIVEITTQTMLGLASRVTLMEPAAPIATTLKPLMAETTADSEATPEPVKELPATENILISKPITEIRKRVELGTEAVSLGLNCLNDRQCQLADPNAVCNARGVCDCALAESTTETQCSAERTGCAPGTFQCRSSGVCISWFFVCDGRPDCNDDSDEECTFNARFNQTCPQEAFQCERSGRCISRAARCDGRKQCPHGEDELGCNALKSGECPPHTFRCKSGECLPEYEYCNAIISCRDGSDEPPHLCGSRSMPTFFLRLLNAGGLLGNEYAYCPHRCSNGRCRSTAIVCSGRDGCGDGTDEKTCSVCRCPAPNSNRLPNFLARHRPMPLW